MFKQALIGNCVVALTLAQAIGEELTTAEPNRFSVETNADGITIIRPQYRREEAKPDTSKEKLGIEISAERKFHQAAEDKAVSSQGALILYPAHMPVWRLQDSGSRYKTANPSGAPFIRTPQN